MNRVMPQTQDYSPQFETQRPPVFQQRVRFHSPPQQAPIHRPRRQTIRLNRSRTVRYALSDVNITPNTQQQSTQHPRMIAPQCYFCLFTACPPTNLCTTSVMIKLLILQCVKIAMLWRTFTFGKIAIRCK